MTATAADSARKTRLKRIRLRLRGLTLPVSSLTGRILVINMLALAIPIGGVMYLDRYQQSLIAAELEALRVQGEIFAGALGAGAAVVVPGRGQVLDPERAQHLLRRLVAPTPTRARLFADTGALVVDTHSHGGARPAVRIEELPPPRQGWQPLRPLVDGFERLMNWVPGRAELPLYREPTFQTSADYQEVRRAMYGESVGAVRDNGHGGMVLSVAVPVQRYKQILGAVMLTSGSSEIERNLRAVRIDILRVFAVGLAVTVLLSLYLAGTIARPLRRLADAAQRIRRATQRQSAIPDFSGRGDEIGALSVSLREMTEALWSRMDAIERFAADVSHEIKNPLSSLRSAVETVARVKDPEQQRKLMAIIVEDVQRLDRLITDISDASRLDSELSRAEIEPVDIGRLLMALVEIQQTTANPGAPQIVLDLPERSSLEVTGIEGRLGQVFRNILANAASFSPPGGRITCRARRGPGQGGETVRVAIEDEGPGIPDNKLEAIFDRFYSERPHGEKFGTHSGLGLSISRQIVEATGGKLWAENRHDAAGHVCGARFVIELPARRRGS